MQVDFDYGVDSIEMVIINSMAPMESFTAELGRGQSEFPIKNYIGQQARPCLGQAPAGWQLTGRRTLSQPWNEMPGGKSVLLQLSSPIFMFTRFRKSSKKTLKQLRRRWDDCRCEGGRKGGVRLPGAVFQIETIDCGTNQFVYEFDNLHLVEVWLSFFYTFVNCIWHQPCHLLYALWVNKYVGYILMLTLVTHE